MLVVKGVRCIGLSSFITYEPDMLYKTSKLRMVEWFSMDHRPVCEFNTPSQALMDTRNALHRVFGVEAADVASRNSKRLVWVSRRNGQHRRIDNEDEILGSIKESVPDLEVIVFKGTEGMVRTAGTSPEDTRGTVLMIAGAELFGGASIVAGPHGAGYSTHCSIPCSLRFC